jgi:hypothetical protein
MQSAARLREEDDIELAEQVERYARALPPVDSEKRKMQRAIIAQVRERLRQQHGRDRDTS